LGLDYKYIKKLTLDLELNIIFQNNWIQNLNLTQDSNYKITHSTLFQDLLLKLFQDKNSTKSLRIENIGQVRMLKPLASSATSRPRLVLQGPVHNVGWLKTFYLYRLYVEIN
jgi:hypothetical protein